MYPVCWAVAKSGCSQGTQYHSWGVIIYMSHCCAGDTCTYSAVVRETEQDGLTRITLSPRTNNISMFLFSTLRLIRYGPHLQRKHGQTYSAWHGLSILCHVYRLHSLLCCANNEIHMGIVGLRIFSLGSLGKGHATHM